MQRSLLSRSPRGFLLSPRSNDGDSQRVTVPDAAGSAAASTAGGTGAKGACPELGPRRMQRSLLSRSPRGLLLTLRSNDGDSQRVTVPDAAGSAAASTAGGTGAKGACPGLGPRRMQRSSLSRSPRGFLLTPRSNDGDRPAGPAPPLPKSLADVCRDWHRRCLSRVGTAADAKIVAVTVATRAFADAAVQRRGQSASDSPRCCGQRGGFDSRGTGAKCACPGLGPRRMQRASLSPSPRGFLLTPRSNDGDSQQVTVPPVTALYGVIEEATLPVRRVTRAGRHKKARRCRGEERVGQPVAEPRRQRLAWKLDGVMAPWPTSAEACRRRSFNTTTNPRPQRP